MDRELIIKRLGIIIGLIGITEFILWKLFIHHWTGLIFGGIGLFLIGYYGGSNR